jgi:hypothetical protein
MANLLQYNFLFIHAHRYIWVLVGVQADLVLKSTSSCLLEWTTNTHWVVLLHGIMGVACLFAITVMDLSSIDQH